MVADLSTARTIAEVDEGSARLLSGAQRPIVLMPRREDAPVAHAVAPHNPDLGVMLATHPSTRCSSGSPVTNRVRRHS